MAAQRTILIIEDDADFRESVRDALAMEYRTFLEAKTAEEALKLFPLHDIDVVICDIMLPGTDGMEALRQIKELRKDTQVVMVTGVKDTETAVEAMRLGALHYLIKGTRYLLKELRVVVDRAIDQRRLTEERDEWRRQAVRHSGRLLGKSEAMQRILNIIEQVAPTNSTVLITGQTGTGKDQVAQEIHEQSRRSDKPLIKVDCASLPESLLESELFGHVKGAFTGAIKDRKGRFELADGGTIFLNEIGEMSASAQQRLLRILQDSELERVGSSTTIHVDVRVIAATNKDLLQMIVAKTFREDLYYRLRVVQIPIPPLSERKSDIPILAQSFLKRYSQETGKQLHEFDPEVIKLFSTYSWPGNVRELQHTVEHAAVFAKDSRVTLQDIPEEISRGHMAMVEPGIPPMPDLTEHIVISIGTTLEDAELEIIRKTLDKVKGNKEEAARILGLSRSSLYRRLPKLNLPDLQEEFTSNE